MADTSWLDAAPEHGSAKDTSWLDAAPEHDEGVVCKITQGVKDYFSGPVGTGLPVVGPMAANAGRAAAAGVGSLFSDKSYGDLKSQYDKQDETESAEYADKHPALAFAKNVQQGFAIPTPTLGLKAAAEAPALVRGAVGLADTVIPNAAIAGADTASRGGSSDEILQAAKEAGIAGGALKGLSAGTNAFAGIDPKAATEALGNTVQRAAPFAGAALGGSLIRHDPIAAGAAGLGVLGLSHAANAYGKPLLEKSLQGIKQVLNSPGGEGFRKILEGVAQQGPEALAVAHQLLMKNNPQYRKLMEGAGE